MTKLPPLDKSTLIISLLLVFLSGCSITNDTTYPCPDRPELMPVPVDLQIQMPPDAVWIVSENQLALKRYAAKLEEIAGCDT